MSIQVQCGNPACGKVHRFKNRYAGMTGRCPDCGTPITVPKLAVPVPAPAAPEPALQAAPSAPPPPISPAPALQGVADDEIDFSALMEEDTPAAEAAEEAPAALTAQDEAEIAEMAEMAEVAEAEEPVPAAAETPRPTNGEEAKVRPRLALDDESEVAEVAELGEVVEEAEAAEVAEAAPEAGTPPGANGPGKQLRPLLSPPDEAEVAEVAEVAEIAEGEDVEEAEVAEAEEAEEAKPARGAPRLNLLAAIFFGVGVLCLIALGFTIYLGSSPARTTIGKNHTVVAVGPVSGIAFTCISLGVGLFAGICLAVALVFRRRALDLLMLGAGYLAYVWSGLVFVFCLALVWGALAAPKNTSAGPPPGRGGMPGGMQGGRPGVPGGGMRGGQPGGQPGGAGGQPGGAQLSPAAPNLPRHVDLTPGTDEWASLVVSAVCLICFWVGMFRLHHWKMLFILLVGVGVVLGGFLLFVMEPWKGPMGTQVFG